MLEEFVLRVDPVVEADLSDPGARYGPIWVAANANDVVGSAAIHRLEDGSAELKRMYLRPSHRGRGLGRSLLETAIGWARGERVHLGSARLDTSEAMTGAQRLYEVNWTSASSRHRRR